jgi:hypothetical protein
MQKKTGKIRQKLKVFFGILFLKTNNFNNTNLEDKKLSARLF